MAAWARTVHLQLVQDALPLHTGIPIMVVRPARNMEAVVADASVRAAA